MNDDKAYPEEETEELDDGEKIEKGFTEMEMLYRSRCFQAPTGQNVFIREIEKKEDK